MSKDELVIGPYFRSPAACHDYDPRIPAVARRIASLITSRFPALTVEHVGSTSVPGCAGKGVIDLMVVYPPRLLEDAKAVLADLGFQRQISPDPHPPTPRIARCEQGQYNTRKAPSVSMPMCLPWIHPRLSSYALSVTG